MKIARNKVARLTNFACVSSCKAPTLKDRVVEGSVEFDDDSWWFVKRAVATEPFYGSGEGQYEIIHVSKGKRKGRSKNCGSSG